MHESAVHRFHTLGLLPPMAPGLMEPVSWYRHRILDTQPCETRSCLEMTHGLMPWWAISTILCRMWLGRGLPLMKTPPSWFTRPWPSGVDTILQQHEKSLSAASRVSSTCWKTTRMYVNYCMWCLPAIKSCRKSICCTWPLLYKIINLRDYWNW